MVCDFCVTGHTITFDHYFDMMTSFFEPNLNDRDEFEDEEILFQKDGTIVYTAR